jgi:pimeloyl-ACP methyl ester carboxylesterase
MTLVRWLGPWADAAARPEVGGIEDHMLAGDGGAPMRVRVYRPARAARATILVAPGLHYAGADDPRMDRFCRILAAAGHLVIAPYIPDFLALVPTRRAIDDFERVFNARARWDPSGRAPVVFSISFGCLLALGLAARLATIALERVILFGGYGDLGAALRFALTGTTRDPLNQPVILMNLLAHLDPPASDPAALTAAWRLYVERTWGRPELKARERFTAIAHELAPAVPAGVRDLFLVGIGVSPGAVELVTPAIARASAGAAALDVRRFLPLVRGRVDIIHGRDDDVIPFEQAEVLAAGLTHAQVRVHLTGLYAHTGGTRPSLASARSELATMARIIRLLARP